MLIKKIRHYSKSTYSELLQRIIAALTIIALLCLLIACSGSTQRNANVVDEESPQGASVSWDDAIFGSDYFVDIESDESFRFNVKPQDRAKFINRGSYIVNSIGACGSCHAANGSMLGGGKVINDSFGDVVVPNITGDLNTGIGEWSNAEIVQALRSSISRDGRVLSPESHAGYRWISDSDATAIAEYLRSLTPYRNNVERRQLSSFDYKTLGIIDKNRTVMGYVPSPPRTETAEYGRYLAVQVGGCARCHHGPEGVFSEAEPFSGNTDDEFGGPDIRGKSGRLRDWTTDDYVVYLTSGGSPDRKGSDRSSCPWPFYSKMSNSDKVAIAKLLKSL